MLMIAGGRPLGLPRRFCIAMKMPKFVLLSAHEASTIAALGAAALAHSTSIAASKSAGFTPGSAQEFQGTCGCICVRVPCGKFCARPKVVRNVYQSSVV